jgi:hypothetical protein
MLRRNESRLAPVGRAFACSAKDDWLGNRNRLSSDAVSKDARGLPAMELMKRSALAKRSSLLKALELDVREKGQSELEGVISVFRMACRCFRASMALDRADRQNGVLIETGKREN